MNDEQNDLAPLVERMQTRLQHLLRRRERILHILIENENKIETLGSNLDELFNLMGDDNRETL